MSTFKLHCDGNTNYSVDFSSESIDNTKKLVHRCSKLHIMGYLNLKDLMESQGKY